MSRNSRAILIAVVATATIVAATLIAVSAVQGDPPPRTSTAATLRAQHELFTGIPQQGIVLGSPAAPVMLLEFADLNARCRALGP